jgi:urea transport system permease protein
VLGGAAVFAHWASTARAQTDTAPPASTQPVPAGAVPVAPELVDALKGLKAPGEPARQKVYQVLEEKGDARLIPALRAFSDGMLQLQGDRLVMYGAPVDLPGGGKGYPLLDAITLRPVTNPDGSPRVDAKLDLSGAFRKPLTASAREGVNRLIAALSLLSPDPQTRLASVRDVAERAARAFPDPKASPADQKKNLDELARYGTALKRLRAQPADAKMTAALSEAGAAVDVVLGDRAAKLAAVNTLGEMKTSRAANLLGKVVEAARRDGDVQLLNAAEPALKTVEGYQSRIRLVKHTFDGLSSGSILVLLALGLSIVFGLMGVINMAHGEFMMLGAFATYVVSEWFKRAMPGYFDYYPIVAVPAAFAVSAGVGLLCENLVVRHLYGRPLETLLATWGLGLILIQAVRQQFGDTLSVTPPSWMSGSVEVMPDLNLGLNRIFIVVYAGLCIAVVYFLVNRTKLGLLLRATTQNREMAAALGVGTRRVDAITFAFGAGLAGLAGVAVPMYDKINPGMGGDYVVESFMVVVVGGVGKLAGVVWAGLGLGFVRKYLEPALQYIPMFDSSASVIGRVVVLAMIVAFLQWRPSGIFPPKGRLADA